MAYDVSTITISGASLLASATASDKLILVGCDATTEVLTQEQAVAVTTRPANPFSNTTRISLEGSDGNHVYVRVMFVAGESTGGDANTLYLYGHPESDSTTNTVLAVLSSADGFHLPVSGDVANTYRTLFDVIYTPESGAIETINTSAYATYAEFKRLKDRTVTTYKEGDMTAGDNQTIRGIKSFRQPINFPAVGADSYDIITMSNANEKMVGKAGGEIVPAQYSGSTVDYYLLTHYQKLWTTNTAVADNHLVGFTTSESLQSGGYDGVESHNKLISSYCTAAGVPSKETAKIDFGFKQYGEQNSSLGRRGFVELRASAYTDTSSSSTSSSTFRLSNSENGSTGALLADKFTLSSDQTYLYSKEFYIGETSDDVEITFQNMPQGTSLMQNCITSGDGLYYGTILNGYHGSFEDSMQSRDVQYDCRRKILVSCDDNHADIESIAKQYDSDIFIRSYSGSTKTINCGVVNVNKTAVNLISTSSTVGHSSVINIQPITTSGAYGIRSTVTIASGQYASIQFKYVGQEGSNDVFLLEPVLSTNTVLDFGTSSHKLRNIHAENLYGTAMNAFSSASQDSASGTLKFTNGDGTTSSNVGIDLILSQILKGQFSSQSQVGQMHLCIFTLRSNLSSSLSINSGDEYCYDGNDPDLNTIAAYGDLYSVRLSGSGTSFGNVSYDGVRLTGRWTLLSGGYFGGSAVIGDWAVVLAIKTGLN